MTPIHFHFEFASPYSYIASLQIDAIAKAAGRTVDWLPIELDAVWKASGVLDAYSQIRRLKRPYIARDAARCARMCGTVLATPCAPAHGAPVAKLAYWGMRNQEPRLGEAFLKAVWHRYFGEGQSITGLADLVLASRSLGLDARTIQSASAWTGARQAQDASNAAAVDSGCFGVPWFIADGESFFGQDRLPHLAVHLNANPALGGREGQRTRSMPCDPFLTLPSNSPREIQ